MDNETQKMTKQILSKLKHYSFWLTYEEITDLVVILENCQSRKQSGMTTEMLERKLGIL